MITLAIDAPGVEKVWRGFRGSVDLMPVEGEDAYQLRGALQISGPGYRVEFVGTAAELEAFKDRLVEALESPAW